MLWELRFLRTIDLSHNELTGSISPAVGSLPNLEYLILNRNQLTGSIPSEIVKCKRLIALVAYGNSLSGPIPLNIGLLGASLRLLDLSFNHLSGPVPGSFGELARIEEVYLNHNRLTGPLPMTLEKLRQVKLLRLEENEFDNTVANAGSATVFADPEHDTWVEQQMQDWRHGLEFPSPATKARRRKREQQEQAKEMQQAKAAGEQAALDRKAVDLLPPAFRPASLKKSAGPPGSSLPSQPSNFPTSDGT